MAASVEPVKVNVCDDDWKIYFIPPSKPKPKTIEWKDWSITSREELSSACCSGNIDRIQQLLEKGVAPNYNSHDKIFPLLDLVSRSTNWGQEKRYLECIRIMLDSGVRVDQQDSFGNTPIKTALIQRNSDVVKLLSSPTPEPPGFEYSSERARVLVHHHEPITLSGTEYKIQQKIGSGACGIVMGAINVETEEKVAIKIIELTDMEDQAHQLVNENDGHPNVVKFHSSDFLWEKKWLVMEWIEGKTLGQLLDEGKALTEEQKTEIADAHEFLSRIGVVVQRENPRENIMVTKEGVAKVIDLGDTYG